MLSFLCRKLFQDTIVIYVAVGIVSAVFMCVCLSVCVPVIWTDSHGSAAVAAAVYCVWS